jgi:hypothetical protein
VLLAIVPVDVLLESSAISTLFYYYIVLFILCFVWNGAVMYLYNSHHVRLSVTFTYRHLLWMELAQDRRHKLDITTDELRNAEPRTMWPITYCVNHSNITLDSNWNYAILTKLCSRNCDFMIRNLVVIKKDNAIVKWDNEPSGLKDDWTLYYKSLTCQDVYNVLLPIYKQLDNGA